MFAKAAHDRVVKLVESILGLHKQLATAKSAAQKAILQRQIEAIPTGGTAIDRLVYDLYPSADRTAEEIALIENSTSEAKATAKLGPKRATQTAG